MHTLAYGGDVSCNFDSELWFKGHCNWIYSSLTSDFFAWSKHPNKNGNFSASPKSVQSIQGRPERPL